MLELWLAGFLVSKSSTVVTAQARRCWAGLRVQQRAILCCAGKGLPAHQRPVQQAAWNNIVYPTQLEGSNHASSKHVPGYALRARYWLEALFHTTVGERNAP